MASRRLKGTTMTSWRGATFGSPRYRPPLLLLYGRHLTSFPNKSPSPSSMKMEACLLQTGSLSESLGPRTFSTILVTPIRGSPRLEAGHTLLLTFLGMELTWPRILSSLTPRQVRLFREM